MAKKRIELDIVTDTTGEILRSQRLSLAETEGDASMFLARLSELNERQIQLEQLTRMISPQESFFQPLIQSLSTLPKKNHLYH